MPVVAMPDGANVQFPDDMPPDQIKSLILQKFPQLSNPAEVESLANAPANREFLGNMVKNVPSSAANLASSMVQPIIHPIDTATGLYNAGKGALQKAGVVAGEDAIPSADAIGQFFKDRYGGSKEIAKTIEEDPVGFLADLSTLLTAGGSAAARAPGVAGKLGEVAAAVGRTVDPLNAVSGTAKLAGKIGAEAIGGLTGTGGKSLELAAQAGAAGGSKAQAFADNIRGNADMGDAINEAKAAVAKLRADRGAEYRAGMAKVGQDQTVLDFNKIDQAVQSAEAIKTYKGQDLSPKTKAVRDDMIEAVRKWQALDPKEFHTAEGLDALKQTLGDIRDSTEHGTPARLAADRIYQSVRGTIIDQAPEYAKIMSGYEDATKLVSEMEKTLSLKPGASIDTSLRKLQSVLRNNVNTNFGNRSALVDFLDAAGAKNLLSKLAGQSLSSWLPRGLGHVANTTELIAALHELTNGNPKAAAVIAALLPASSPRLAGETAFKIGQASRLPLRQGAQASYQLGRLPLQ